MAVKKMNSVEKLMETLQKFRNGKISAADARTEARMTTVIMNCHRTKGWYKKQKGLEVNIKDLD